jgi:hypothetical protein
MKNVCHKAISMFWRYTQVFKRLILIDICFILYLLLKNEAQAVILND